MKMSLLQHHDPEPDGIVVEGTIADVLRLITELKPEWVSQLETKAIQRMREEAEIEIKKAESRAYRRCMDLLDNEFDFRKGEGAQKAARLHRTIYHWVREAWPADID
jgi:hypothetical protein